MQVGLRMLKFFGVETDLAGRTTPADVDRMILAVHGPDFGDLLTQIGDLRSQVATLQGELDRLKRPTDPPVQSLRVWVEPGAVVYSIPATRVISRPAAVIGLLL